LGNVNPGNWVFSVMLGNDIALACYIFDIHQPILIYFVDNKVVLRNSVQIIIISLLAILVKHQFVNILNADGRSTQ